MIEAHKSIPLVLMTTLWSGVTDQFNSSKVNCWTLHASMRMEDSEVSTSSSSGKHQGQMGQRLMYTPGQADNQAPEVKNMSSY